MADLSFMDSPNKKIICLLLFSMIKGVGTASRIMLISDKSLIAVICICRFSGSALSGEAK
jgi:hypothetical protein